MTRYGGYLGKFLRVNLTENKIVEEQLEDKFIEKFVGGNGFGAAYLFKELPGGIDPLGPENKVILATGPLSGTPIISSPKIGFFAKSPLTGGFMDSYSGGHLSAELKFAGYDGVIIEGFSSKPVFLDINNGIAKIRDAENLWGLGTFETTRKIKEELGDDQYKIAVIGPGGENLVNYAAIIVENFHAAGRGGIGAVMGSKNLKAIAVRGTQYSPKIYNIDLLTSVAENLYREVTNDKTLMLKQKRYGTAGATSSNAASGILGTKNWQQETFDNADKIGGDAFADNVFDKNLACYGCPVKCLQKSSIKKGKYKRLESVGPQYETIYSFGSLCENDDPAVIMAANNMCNDLGLDTISAGVTIAFAMECYEKELVPRAEFGINAEPKFGNKEALLELISKIALRQDIGELLANGVKKAAAKIGQGSEDFAIHVKGLELAGHSARGYKGMTLGYAVSNRGGSHMDMRHVEERSGKFDRKSIDGKPELNYNIQSSTVIRDTLGYCTVIESAFGRVGISDAMIEVLNGVTGINFDKDSLQLLADRIWNLERAFNVREGKGREEDTLPPRFMNEPIPEGPSAGMIAKPEELEKMLNEYYHLRGWDIKSGIPTKETLERLELDFVIDELFQI